MPTWGMFGKSYILTAFVCLLTNLNPGFVSLTWQQQIEFALCKQKINISQTRKNMHVCQPNTKILPQILLARPIHFPQPKLPPKTKFSMQPIHWIPWPKYPTYSMPPKPFHIKHTGLASVYKSDMLKNSEIAVAYLQNLFFLPWRA